MHFLDRGLLVPENCPGGLGHETARQAPEFGIDVLLNLLARFAIMGSGVRVDLAGTSTWHQNELALYAGGCDQGCMVATA